MTPKKQRVCLASGNRRGDNYDDKSKHQVILKSVSHHTQASIIHWQMIALATKYSRLSVARTLMALLPCLLELESLGKNPIAADWG